MRPRAAAGVGGGGRGDAGYPGDLHSAEFGPGTPLVARRDGRPWAVAGAFRSTMG